MASYRSPRPPSVPSFSSFGFSPALAGGPAASLLGGPSRPRTDWTDRLTPRGGQSAALVQGTGRAPTLDPRTPLGHPLPEPTVGGPRPPHTPPPPPQTPPRPGPQGPARRGPATGALRSRLAVAAVAAGALATAGQSLAGLESLAPTDDATTAELALTARGTTDTPGTASAAGGTGGSVLDAATSGVLPVATAGSARSVATATPSSTAAASGGTSTSPAGAIGGQVTSLTKAAQRAAAASAAQVAAQEAAARPEYVKPAQGRFTSGFGARWGKSHRGVDIAGPIGTPIVSVADGEVVESGPASGFGMWVRVRLDDGTINVYGHVNRSYVREGQRVRAGEEIAEIGNRGHSTGPHLHFEVWLDGGQKINPLPWLAEHGVSLGSPQD